MTVEVDGKEFEVEKMWRRDTGEQWFMLEVNVEEPVPSGERWKLEKVMNVSSRENLTEDVIESGLNSISRENPDLTISFFRVVECSVARRCVVE